MTNIALLVTCFLAGLLLRRTGRFPEATPATLNGFIIHISLPALALLHVHRLQLDRSLLTTAAMAWLLFAISVPVFHWGGRLMGLDRRTIGALILVCGLGNTSFVGLPMIEAFYGREYLGVGLIADQFGSFLVLSTLGVLVATVSASREPSPRQMARRILLFPPLQALVLAIILRPVPFPEMLSTVLQKLGDTLTPLALASVGFQLRFGGLRGELRPLLVGLLYKLAVGPALLLLIFAGLLGQGGPVLQVTVFEAAMAPMITAGIVAVDHELNPPLVAMLLGIGIPLSFLTLPLWWQMLKWF